MALVCPCNIRRVELFVFIFPMVNLTFLKYLGHSSGERAVPVAIFETDPGTILHKNCSFCISQTVQFTYPHAVHVPFRDCKALFKEMV